MKPTSQALSVTLHALVVVLLLMLPRTEFSAVDVLRDNPLRPQKLLWMPAPAPQAARDGGGARQLLPATRGAIPQIIHRPFQPPKIQHENEPKLILASGLDIAVPRVDLPQLGDPNSLHNAAASAGPGHGTGFGNDGTGPLGNHGGDDPQSKAGGLTKVLGATPPTLVHKVEPDYSDEARKARLQGSVLIAIDIDARGHVSNIRVLRPLGLGLDEKAMNAVAQWRFKPAVKDGRAIAYPAAVEVRFQLL